MKKCIGLGVSAAVVLAVVARGDSPRTLRVREDQRPAKGQLEVSIAGEATERESVIPGSEKLETVQAAAQLRYGLGRDFTINASVPFVSRDAEIGGSESGIGDVRVGFELVTWRDIFDFPYIMPYAEVTAPTGDDKKGLGAGEVTGAVGISLGSTAIRYTHFVIDVRYLIIPDGDNVVSGGLAMIHEFSKQFAVSIEGILRDKSEGDAKRPKAVIGGMTYKPWAGWAFSVFGGTESGGANDGSIAGARVSYTFK